MGEIIQHNGKLYSIANKHKGWFYIIKAQPLPTGQTLVEELRKVKAITSTRVEKLIKEGKYETFVDCAED